MLHTGEVNLHLIDKILKYQDSRNSLDVTKCN